MARVYTRSWFFAFYFQIHSILTNRYVPSGIHLQAKMEIILSPVNFIYS